MKKRILSLLLTLLAALACTFPALAAGEDFTYAITVNGGASDTVKVGETVQVALTLTCNTDDTFNLYAMCSIYMLSLSAGCPAGHKSKRRCKIHAENHRKVRDDLPD